jgi:predicted HTH transcriptional regulator
VALGSFTHGALADVLPEDVDRMLALDETLFVEHKTDIGKDSAHELVRAVAAFANTIGGWLLIGVTNRKPNGKASRWADSENAPTLVDTVRERLRHEIDPLPAFEAKVIEHREGPVGVVRVYESSDTPHVVLRSGSVFVREVAGTGELFEPKQSGSGRHRERAYEVG